MELLQKTEAYPGEMGEEETQVLVVGGGGAGVSAALEAVGLGVKVMLVTKDKLGASNTVLAQGGMAAAIGDDDSPLLHARDTLEGGQSNNERLVKIMTEEAPRQVSWLESLG